MKGEKHWTGEHGNIIWQGREEDLIENWVEEWISEQLIERSIVEMQNVRQDIHKLVVDIEVGTGDDYIAGGDNASQLADGAESMDVETEVEMVDLQEVKIVLDMSQKQEKRYRH